MRRNPVSSVGIAGLMLLHLLTAGSATGGTSRASSLAADDADRQDAIVEDVHFCHGDNRLAGALYLPKKPGPHPAVVLILGSGEQDRGYGGTGPALGEHFARHGFACLAWDKPGVGKSTGDYNAQTFRDRAEEALAAVDFLRARKDIPLTPIGLWGHSQGGIVAPLAASLSDKVAFVIEVSGLQGPVWRQDQVRVEAELRADGFPEADVVRAVALAKERMDLIRGTEAFEMLDRKQKAVKSEAWFEYVHYCDRALFHSARNIIKYDTGPFWEAVHWPVLVIFGDKDTSSGPPEPLVGIIRRGWEKAGNKDVVVNVFHDADHSLGKSKSGGRKEAREHSKGKNPEAGPDFVEGYLDTMTNWLGHRCPPKPAAESFWRQPGGKTTSSSASNCGDVPFSGRGDAREIAPPKQFL